MRSIRSSVRRAPRAAPTSITCARADDDESDLRSDKIQRKLHLNPIRATG